MKFLIATLFIFSFASHALDIRPGLWAVDMTMMQEGKKIDPMGELQSALKDMPEERKKQMMQAMEESGLSVDAGGKKTAIKQCYTQEMIEQAKVGAHEDENCKTVTSKKSADKIVSKFNCKDGSKGTATINIESDKAYTGHMVMSGPNGEKSELKYDAKYVSGNCGKVKPMGV